MRPDGQQSGGERRGVIFVGLPKTGSTTVQHALFARRRQLARAGILYHPAAANHTDLLCTAFARNPVQHITLRVRDAAVEDAPVLREAALRRLHEGFGGPWQLAVLSAEGVSNLGAPELREMVAMLRTQAPGWRAVLWLREPLAYMRSLVQQLVRSGLTIDQALARPALEAWPGLIARLQDAFGPEAVEIGSFEAARAAEGCLVAAFARQAGLPGALIPEGAPARNTAMSMTALRVLDRLNGTCPFWIDGRRNPARPLWQTRALVRLPGPRFDLSPAQAEAVLARAVPVLEQLRTRFGIDPYPDIRQGRVPSLPAPRRHPRVEAAVLASLQAFAGLARR